MLAQLDWKGPVYSISAITKSGTEDLVFNIMKQLEIDREFEIDNPQQELDNDFEDIQKQDAE